MLSCLTTILDAYKQGCRQSDMPVKLTFQSLKEITNNFANKLGCGASAEVYKGVFNGEVIAVKKMPFKIWIDEKQFQNEYEHLMRLKHHNIVRLVAFCDETEHVDVEYEGQTIIAEEIHRALCLEFLPHGSLSEHIREKHPGLNWPTRFQIIMGMCVGLKYIHEVSVVHLDIKPDNILLDAKMIPKIGDFGISRLLSEECMRDANVTLLGTIGYIPPEFIDNQVISREFDVFSLGVTIKKIVTEAMDYWNISYMNHEECIEHVHDNWRKRFEEIPGYPLLGEHCRQVRTCIDIALQCMYDDRLSRPSMNHIVSKLIPEEYSTSTYCSVEDSSANWKKPKEDFSTDTVKVTGTVYSYSADTVGIPCKANWVEEPCSADWVQASCFPESDKLEVLPIDIPEMPSPDSHISTCELPIKFLREITNNFSEERIVYEGGSTTFFKGIVSSGEETLVKRFRASKKEAPDKVFQNKVGKIMEIKHENIVPLLGYCDEKKREVINHDGRYILTCTVDTFLWYEYLPNKSLDRYIYGNFSQLDWNMRFKIILAVCEALHFLHIKLNRPISHHPLTPENILLDKNMVPKLSDIGLSDLFDRLSPEGTEYDPEINRYKAPEYIKGYTISFQSDIYSLGLLIMDITTGEKDSSHARQTMDSSDFANVRQKWSDEYIASKYTSLDFTCIGQLKACLQIAVWCVEEKTKDRPSIWEIVDTLNNPYLGTMLNQPGVGPNLLLSMQPRHLSFPLVPTKLTSRMLCLTNNKDEPIAFMLLTDNPGRYHTELPLCGVVPPKCTYTINMIVCEQTKQLQLNSDEFLTLMSTRVRENYLKNLDPESIAVLFEDADHEVQPVAETGPRPGGPGPGAWEIFHWLTVAILHCFTLLDTVATKWARGPTLVQQMLLPVIWDPSEETTSDQIITSQNCRVVLSVDVHPTSQNYQHVLSMDVHPNEPWILTTNQRGTLCIWNYQTKEMVISFAVSPGEPVYSAKFIERKHWLVIGDGDGYIHVYNYDTIEEVKNFKAHESNIMSLDVSPSLPWVLSASDDHLIKLWHWDKSWQCVRTFGGHNDRVTQVMFHPQNNNSFASASLDGRVKIWESDYDCIRTFNEHPNSLLCLQYFPDKQFYYCLDLLVVGSSDGFAKVWHPERGRCVGTIEGHTNCLTALCWHPKHEVLVTGSLDGTLQIWKPTTTSYRLENVIGLNLGAITALAYIHESTRVVVGCEQGLAMVEINYP